MHQNILVGQGFEQQLFQESRKVAQFLQKLLDSTRIIGRLIYLKMRLVKSPQPIVNKHI